MVAWAVALGCLLVVAACKPRESARPSQGRAPEWKLKDLEGKDVSFADFKGKVVVVDFWATWCPPCRAEIPGYIEMQKKYGKDGFVIVGISMDEKGPEHVKKFVEQQGINYPVVMGDDGIESAFGGVEAIPTTFLIDRAGNIRDRKVGAVEKTEYEQRILSVLKDRS